MYPTRFAERMVNHMFPSAPDTMLIGAAVAAGNANEVNVPLVVTRPTDAFPKSSVNHSAPSGPLTKP